ncbi:hypothetical protein BOC40_35835 [Burkholderia pseudomallei]|nr:hypothetical protein BOC36_26330 [Burkholderia pseudomallei]EDO90801.1 hypothetical protein BURPSPAST_W0807 [Burkholderia pseudomallei Pasteur 52237]ARK61130.1 hypothetical protein BOC37_15495 [Burkholderia pseudomallei]ARK71422.1 hypothetical protein BOC38_33870 [Burkholderia pseudomallei]ARK74603.1 hypothetical protein BOC39_14040 [Burkholderia pseudomallei]
MRRAARRGEGRGCRAATSALQRPRYAIVRDATHAGGDGGAHVDAQAGTRAHARRLNSTFETFALPRAITGAPVAAVSRGRPHPHRAFAQSHRCNIGESTIGTRSFTNIAASLARPPRPY